MMSILMKRWAYRLSNPINKHIEWGITHSKPLKKKWRKSSLNLKRSHYSLKKEQIITPVTIYTNGIYMQWYDKGCWTTINSRRKRIINK